MARRSRTWAVVACILLVLAWRYGCDDDDDMPAEDSSDRAGDRSAAIPRTGRADIPALGGRPQRSGSIAFDPDESTDGIVVTGTVIDLDARAPVGGVEVVFRNVLGEESTTAKPDGTYRIRMPAGVYRAFVRDETMISIGISEGERVPGAPSLEMVSVPDEVLMPVVVATRDVEGVELTVVRGATIHGEVVDPDGRPVPEALVWIPGSGQLRPTLGTDIAESDALGKFEMRVPAGYYSFGVQAPRHAVVVEGDQVEVEAGATATARIVVGAGCEITGHVFLANGKPTGDGVIEMQIDLDDEQPQFSPVGRVEADGSFRFAVPGEETVVLRAWPWKSPHSDAQRFACKNGLRFRNVVLRVSDRKPDIAGFLVDASGDPVPFAFVDLAPLDEGGLAQQERTDANGEWGVYNMPAGRYQLSASAAGKGFATVEVRSPSTEQLVQLGGVGTLSGTTSALQDGSFEIRFQSCTSDEWTFSLNSQRRVVPVIAGHFEISDVPACALAFTVAWHGKETSGEVVVPPDGTAQITVEVGPPVAKTVRGRVLDPTRKPATNVHVVARFDDEEPSETRTDSNGRYTLRTFSGASVTAETETAYGEVMVGTERAPDEELADITMEAMTSYEGEPGGEDEDEIGVDEPE